MKTLSYNYTEYIVNIVGMYITKIPNRNSPPAILLREGYRENGKVKNRTLANLKLPPQSIDILKRSLKVFGTVLPKFTYRPHISA